MSGNSRILLLVQYALPVEVTGRTAKTDVITATRQQRFLAAGHSYLTMTG
jgi:hypothetical protein